MAAVAVSRFYSLLRRCPSMKQLKQLHAQLIANGLLPGETFLAAELVSFCSVSDAGDLRYGRRVFEMVAAPNTFMWNSLIRGYSNSDTPEEALRLLPRLLRQGLLPNQYTLPFLLKSCARLSASAEVLIIHALTLKRGFESQIFVANALLNAYASGGSIAFARKVFEEIPSKNTVSWNSIIGAYVQSGDYDEALHLFVLMRDSATTPDKFTMVSILSACAQTQHIDLGRLIHHYTVVTGTDVDVILGNALVDMYGKCGQICVAQRCLDRMTVRNVVSWTCMICAYAKHGFLDVARSWFDRMPERNTISWNAMISCYAQHGFYCEALGLYGIMQSSNVAPDEATLVAALSAASQIGDLIMGRKIHMFISDHVANPSITLYNSLVDMYAKCGSVDTAMELFSLMPRKNRVSWNVIIGALAMHGCALDAIQLFKQMVAEGDSPDAITFTGLLCACSHGGFLEFGLQYFEAMTQVFRIPKEIQHYACMVDLLGRGGQLQQAVELIISMPMKPDVVVWGALLAACRIHGNWKVGQQIMKQLLELESESGGLYVLMSNMYSEMCRWNDMKRLRNLMQDNGIEKESAHSWIEINGNIHEFVVEDIKHSNSDDIYRLLNQLTRHLECMWWTSSPLGEVDGKQ